MINTKKTLILLCIVAGVLILTAPFYVHTYAYPCGYVAADSVCEQPKCYGISVLLNEEETWADAPGENLCIGLLEN